MEGFSFPTPTAVQGSAAPPFPPPWFLAAVAEEDGGGGGEEKMDMLWEDFNEELACAAPVCPLSPLHGDSNGGLMTMAMMKDATWLDSDSDGDVRGGSPEGKLRRRRHYMVVRRRRWSLVLMLRLLKKLFLAKKSRSQSQRTAPLISEQHIRRTELQIS